MICLIHIVLKMAKSLRCKSRVRARNIKREGYEKKELERLKKMIDKAKTSGTDDAEVKDIYNGMLICALVFHVNPNFAIKNVSQSYFNSLNSLNLHMLINYCATR